VSASREAILASMRAALGRTGDTAEQRAGIEARIAAHPRNLIPKRALLDHAGQVRLFVEMAEKAAATIAWVPRLADVPAAAANFLSAQNLPAVLRLAADPILEALPWSEWPLVKIETGPARRSDSASLTPAFAGIAETGTLMLISSQGTPTTLNFLPDNHLVVLREAQIVGPFEDAWDRLRIAQEGAWPRTVNYITGPSRSADIEQQLHMGAHGPRRLHIILVAEDRNGQGQA
jgi:L-lactate dehydrogenase complex protein LldG